MTRKKYKLAILTTHVIQYQDPLFKKVARHPEIDLTVFFCSKKGASYYRDHDMKMNLKWDVDLLKGYRYKILRNYSPFKFYDGFLSYFNPGLIRELKQGNYDGIIMMIGWSRLTSWLGFLGCRMYGVSYFIYGDSAFIRDGSFLRREVKKLILKELFKKAAGFMITGTMNAEFYKYYEGDNQRYFSMPWAIDNERFMKACEVPKEKKEDLRKQCGIAKDKITIIYSGKLIKRKNPLHLLQAFEMMNQKEKIEIVYVGEGSERKILESYVKEKKIRGVHFLGFINQSKLPEIYNISNIFVLPSSYDPRGTVTNEAMACGLPVIISDRVGIYGEGDIVRSGENGYVYRDGNINELARLLDQLTENDKLRTVMGKKSLEIISEWNYEKDVEGILKALECVGKKCSLTG